jgi:signal transduction histidine kinase
METALTQSAQLVRSLLDFARQSTPSFKSIAMPLVLDQVIALVKHQAEMRKIHIIRKEGPDIIPVKAILLNCSRSSSTW